MQKLLVKSKSRKFSNIFSRSSFVILFCLTCTLLLLSMMNVTQRRSEDAVFGDTQSLDPYEDLENFPSDNLTNGCVPKSNIVFIKTHKCASSAIQNILLRYGYSRGKVFVLPSKDNYLGHPALFSRNMVPCPEAFGHDYNILTHHTRFDHHQLKSLMPESTVYITIVRDPVSLFESMFGYYKLQSHFGFNLTDLTDIPVSQKMMQSRYVGRIGFNQMLFDLGLEVTTKNESSLTAVQNHISKLDQIFHLVMVSEQMDYSLVLLKRLLCWDTDSVVTFKVNARQEKTNLSIELAEKIRELNWADQLLYDHFLSKFRKTLAKLNFKLVMEEKERLRRKVQIWYDFCVGSTYVENVLKYEPRNAGNDTCNLLTTSELNLTAIVRNHQRKLFQGSVF